MTWSHFATGGVIALVIGFTLLPIWPDAAKKVLWYLSVTFLIATTAFCLIRWLLFLVSWLFGYDFWIFPRLFDESLSFQDSFKPVYSFDKAAAGQGYYRLAMLVAIAGCGYYVYNQPNEFDGFLKAQSEFLEDLYAGNLLAEVGTVADPRKDNLDKLRARVPSLEELYRQASEEDGSAGEQTDAGTATGQAESQDQSSNSEARTAAWTQVVDEKEASGQDDEKIDDADLERLFHQLDQDDEESSQRRDFGDIDE